MNASSKVLIGIAAVVAFAIGWVVNSARITPAGETQTLLKAELIESEAPQVLGRIQDKLETLNLVNFWASWCAPCREEMPIFQTMYQQHRNMGFQVIGVAIDSPSKTQSMLDSMGITYPILYAEQTGMQLMESVGNANGLLPYTLLLDDTGTVLEQKLGTVHAQDIQAWIEAHR